MIRGTSIFISFKKLYDRTKDNFSGENGFKISFYWEHYFLTGPQRIALPKKIDAEEVFNLFKKAGDTITEKVFYEKLKTMYS